MSEIALEIWYSGMHFMFESSVVLYKFIEVVPPKHAAYVRSISWDARAYILQEHQKVLVVHSLVVMWKILLGPRFLETVDVQLCAEKDYRRLREALRSLHLEAYDNLFISFDTNKGATEVFKQMNEVVCRTEQPAQINELQDDHGDFSEGETHEVSKPFLRLREQYLRDPQDSRSKRRI